MRKYYAMLLMFSILIAASLASSITNPSSSSAAPSSTSQPASMTVSVPYSNPPAPEIAPITQTGQKSYPLSPANAVYNSNAQNSLYLLTCPQSPNPSSSWNQLFFLPSADYGSWKIAGNLCQSGSSQSSFSVTATFINYLQSPGSALPTVFLSQPELFFSNAVSLNIINLGYSPEVVTQNGNFISSAFGTKSYVFKTMSPQGQQGLWTWFARYADLSYLNRQNQANHLSSTATQQDTYSSGTCQYTYTLNSKAMLEGMANANLPFLDAGGHTTSIGLLPYLVYNANITNPNPSNEFNIGLSYDIYSPKNFVNPQNVIEPFTINSLGFFFGNYNGNLAYFNTVNGIGADLTSPQDAIGVLSSGQSNGPGSIQSGTCPNKNYMGDQTTQLTFDQVAACAQQAGFSGTQLEIIVSIAYAESSFHPGECYGGTSPCPLSEPQGLLQNGPGNLDGYNPSTCGTGSNYWWFNPSCEMAWARAYTTYWTDPYVASDCPGPVTGSTFCYWQTYGDPSAGDFVGAYCQYMPKGFSGDNCPASDSGSHALAWNSVGASLSSQGLAQITPISISAMPNQGYIFVLGNTVAQNTNLYILKVIPSGYENTSSYQPNSVIQSYLQSGFDANWTTYWKNVMNLQGQSVYIVNVIPISQSQQITAAISSAFPSASSSQFTPLNISTDLLGDIFITGTASTSIGTGLFNYGWLVEITNTIGNGPIEYQSAPICPNKVSSSLSSTPVCSTTNWPEIAASPTGTLLFLANPSSGFMPIFTANSLTYSSAISLNFTSDNALYGTASSGSGSGSSSTNPPAANIIDYFQNGGLYGINVNGNTQPDQIMKKIIDQANSYAYQYEISLAKASCPQTFKGANSQCTLNTNTPANTVQDQLDKAEWPGLGYNTNYHHPLSIQDVNGYIYVLDYWSGIAGQLGTVGLFGTATPVGGIKFGILMLRIINSSGVDVPIQPTYYNDLWYTSNGNTQLNKYTQSSGLSYPPFGWVISANVSSNEFQSFQTPQPGETLNLCGGNPSSQPGSFPCFQPGSDYKGSYLPIGPELSTESCALVIGTNCRISPISGASMSVGFNNRVSILIPHIPDTSSISISNPGTSPTYSANNNYDELMFVNFNPQNYTGQIGGTNLLPFTPNVDYICYTSNTLNDIANGGKCQYNQNVAALSQPVYEVSNPFQYDENIGGLKILTLGAIYSSVFSVGLGGGGGSGQSKTAVNILAPNPVLSSQASAISGLDLNNLNPNSNPSQYAIATSLNSIISGYALMPFSFTYRTNIWVSNIQPVPNTQSSSTTCPATAPAALAKLEVPVATSNTMYNYTTSPITNSNPQLAHVESSDTYAKSSISTEPFYQANLSSITLPAEILYNILTNRIFGDVYVNSTVNAVTNNQEIINATSQLSFNAISYSQGATPVYQIISSSPSNPVCYGPSCASPLANTHRISPIKNSFSFSVVPSNTLVLLFNFYKLPVTNSNLILTMNGISSQSGKVYGYHRLVYVFNDNFNNLIYMPIDGDIANLTQMSLDVTPNVNGINVNQTQLSINGTLSWTPPYSTNKIPLQGGYVYLYYDANLNTIGYNAIIHPVHASNCVFGNAVPTPNSCQLANPVYNGLQGTTYTSANIVTYSPSYNGLGACSPPPNSLLTPENQIYTFCNIYPNNPSKLPTSCPGPAYGSYYTSSIVSQQAAARAASSGSQSLPSVNQQYCSVIYPQNGTGICTSQLGLIGIYKTDSNGYFGTNIIACGAGSAQILASYYGTPGPEPIIAHQAPLSESANPSYPNSGSISFNALNYSWIPAVNSQSVIIGSLSLAIGQIGLPAIIALGAVILLYGLMRDSRYLKSKKLWASRHSKR
ncbi:MAG: hypothetical protein ACYCO0_02390 [Candidatus Micrarchaeaceae archaeon]